jgi:hypothetical protein
MKMAIYQQGEPNDLNVAKERAKNAELARMYEADEEKTDMHKTAIDCGAA